MRQGYASSRALPEQWPTPRAYAEALYAMLNKLNISSTILVGHSLGCLFAASFAASYRERVCALALLSPALGYRVPVGTFLPTNVQLRINELEALGPSAFASKRAHRLVADPTRNRHVVDAVRFAMAELQLASYAQAVRALGAGNLVADLARISAPAMVVVGSKDVITPPEQARTASAAFRQTVIFHEIADAGHAMPQEQPVAIAGLLSQLVEAAR
jgi:pimeloyl-ACP methyl ester carboxylesterase